MEHAPSNDNALGWDLDGPDEDGLVMLVDNGPTHHATIVLGRFEDVATKFADWLAEHDFGERPSGAQGN